MPQSFLLLVVASALVSLLGSSCSAAASPIVLGTWTNFGYPDFIVQQATGPMSMGFRAVVKAVNSAGGIRGRPLQLVECEATLNTTKYVLCLQNMTAQYPDMVAVMGVFLDSVFHVLQPHILQADILLANPAVLTERTFDRHWFYAKGGTSLLLTTMLGYVVNELHALRIGLLWDTNEFQSIATSPIGKASQMIKDLGLQHVGTLGINSAIQFANGKWMTQDYFDFLDTRPQVIISIGGSSQTAFEMWFDLLNRSVYGAGVDPKLKIVMWEGSSFVASLAIQYLSGVYKVNISAQDRLYIAIGNPTMMDQRYAACRHALEDMRAYYNSNSFLKQNAFFFVSAMQGWYTARLLVAAFQKMDPANITRQSLMDFMLDDTMLAVDDLYAGPFTSRPCTANPPPNGPCQCNDGYRTMETYTFDSSGKLVPAVGKSRFESSIDVCGAGQPSVPPPLIYLSATLSNSNASSAVSSALLDGALAALNAVPDMTALAIARSEIVTAATDSALHQAVIDRANVSFTSLIFPAVVASTLALHPAHFTIDPFYFPAQLAPPFTPTTVHVLATLQQELYALAQYVTENPAVMAPVTAVVRQDPGSGGTAAAQKILSVFQASLVSFGGDMAGASLVADPAAPLSSYLAAGGSGSQLVLGLTSLADVTTIVQFLQQHPKRRIMLSFNELSVWYADIVSLATSASVESRLIFASSLRNWNALNLTSNIASPLMAAFFAAFPNASQRTPLALRGFVVGAAVQRVASQVLPEALTPANMERVWYSISVVPLGSGDLIGAYSQASCFSALDTACETNTGARTVYIMTLADTTTQAATAQNYSSAAVFSSGRITYSVPQPSTTGLSQSVLIGIVVACVIGGLTLMCLTAMNVSRSRTRNNQHAPKDPSRPLCIVFTDIQSSTALWAACPEAMAQALELHHSLMRRLIKKHKCYEVKTIGDAFMVATTSPTSAINFCVDVQTEFFAQSWPKDIDRFYIQAEKEHCETVGQPIPAMLHSAEAYRRCWNGLRVRVGMNFGVAEIKLDDVTGGYDYYGSTVNLAARTEGYSMGGQILLANPMFQEMQKIKAAEPSIASLLDNGKIAGIGEVELKGISDKVELFQVSAMEAREFTMGRKRNLADEEDDQLEVQDFTSTDDGNSSLSEMRASISSSAHALAAMKYSRSDWNSVVAAVIVTLLSTWQESARAKVLQESCERWHIPLPSAWAKKHHHGNTSLVTDPFVQVLSKRIGPMIKNKFRVLPATEGNYTEMPKTPPLPPL